MNHPLQLLFSPLSERDLEEIGDYIARDNPQKAVSFIRGIREQCAKITANPAAAPLRHELGEGIRMVPYGNYLIFYTADINDIRIERVLHGARNIPDIFNG
jgi:toxin ParE1/3/4